MFHNIRADLFQNTDKHFISLNCTTGTVTINSVTWANESEEDTSWSVRVSFESNDVEFWWWMDLVWFESIEFEVVDGCGDRWRKNGGGNTEKEKGGPEGESIFKESTKESQFNAGKCIFNVRIVQSTSINLKDNSKASESSKVPKDPSSSLEAFHVNVNFSSCEASRRIWKAEPDTANPKDLKAVEKMGRVNLTKLTLRKVFVYMFNFHCLSSQ